MAHAFTGIRILDFSQVLAGPAATSFFAMLGADVIKVENPTDGDQFRILMKTDKFEDYRMSPGFMSLNTAKRSLAIDLKHERAKDVIWRLIETADVVVENFRAGAIEDLGFGYDAVRARRPDIIYCSISGYGQTGPMRGRPAYDGAIQAASGMMSVTGHPETGPTRAGYTVVDMSTALTAAFAISQALYRRRETGAGQRLDVAMLDTSIWMMSPLYSAHLLAGETFGLIGNDSPAKLPTANVFPTSDGYLQISGLTREHAKGLCEVLEIEEAESDPRLADLEAMTRHHDELRDYFSDIIRTKPLAHWVERLREARIPHAPIRDFAAATRDPQLAHRDIIRTAPAPSGRAACADAEVPIVGMSFTADDDGPEVFGAPPMVGEHIDAILEEAGYSADEVAELRASGVFGGR